MRGFRHALLMAAAFSLAGCQTVDSILALGSSSPPLGSPGYVRGFLGGVAAEDPAAALAARNVLSAGGTAVDAAVAAAFTMAVTLPSRVGLGGGGACLVFDPDKGGTEAVLFLPGARSGVPAGADRPAAVPMLARGLFALHTRKPGRPFEELMAPAEQLARFGTEVSRGLAADLAAVSGPLFADPGARAVFAGPDGRPLQAGQRLVQPELAGTLGQLRIAGVGDLYQGALARRLVEVSRAAGGNLTLNELRESLPSVTQPLVLPARGGDQIAFLPPPADGGLAAAVSFTALQAGLNLEEAAARGLAAAGAWRERGGDPRAYLNAASQQQGGGNLGALPASAGLMVFDRTGTAVSCAFTLDNLFGTGRMAPGMGFLLGAAPGIGGVRPPLLSAAIAFNPNIRSFRLGVASSGQQAAPISTAGPAALQVLHALSPTEALERGTPEPGRAQFGVCLNYLPGYPDRCIALTDPRGTGVALGAVD
ncbi:MAG: gamma-glutamyltransferase [Acetobacteraceae bacterium]|nr:gamma-glutamyltransferase [Acetobacteraceae bacterium]